MNPPRRALGFPSRLRSLFMQLRAEGFTCSAANQSRGRGGAGRGGAGRGAAPSPCCGVGRLEGAEQGRGAGGGGRPGRGQSPALGRPPAFGAAAFSALVSLEKAAWPRSPRRVQGLGRVKVPPARTLPGGVSGSFPRSTSGACAAFSKGVPTCRSLSVLYVCVCAHTGNNKTYRA